MTQPPRVTAPELFPADGPRGRVPRKAGAGLWAVVALLLAGAAFLQRPGPAPTPTAEEAAAVQPPDFAAQAMGKLAVATEQFAGPGQGMQIAVSMSQSAATPAERFRAAIVLGELSPPAPRRAALPADAAVEPGPDEPGVTPEDGPEPSAPDSPDSPESADLPEPARASGPPAAEELLVELAGSLPDDSPLIADIAALRTIFDRGPEALSADERQGLIDRHEWFGRLALVSRHAEGSGASPAASRPGSAPGSGPAAVALPKREEVLAAAVPLLGFFALLGVGIVGMLGLGTVLLVLGVVQAFRGRLRFAGPAPVHADAALLEMLAIFLAGFMGLKLIGTLAAGSAAPGASWPIYLALIGQWTLMLTLLWPLARGLSWRELRHELALSTPRGALREIGAGILGYIAFFPVLIFAAITAVVVMQITELLRRLGAPPGEPPAPAPLPDNRILELLTQGSFMEVLLVALLATVWAPIVEEVLFRGALFAHLRRRTGLIVTIGVTAIAFALLHAYALVQLIVVGALGACFALLREWRGSLVASITAHALHNGAVLLIMLVLVALASG